MIKRLVLSLETQDKRSPVSFWAYNLYAELLKNIDPAAAEELHQSGLKPLSQCLLTQKGSPVAKWQVNLLNEEACEIFLPALEKTQSYYIEKQDCTLNLTDFKLESQTDEAELVNQIFSSPTAPLGAEIRFLSPAAFKSEEKFVTFPSVDLIVNSALNKWNALAQNTLIRDEEGISQLIEACLIRNYSLSSFSYPIKGLWIPSFTGRLELSVKGPAPMRRLFALLMTSLGYTGLGAKCALGMGGVEVKLKEGNYGR